MPSGSIAIPTFITGWNQVSKILIASPTGRIWVDGERYQPQRVQVQWGQRRRKHEELGERGTPRSPSSGRAGTEARRHHLTYSLEEVAEVLYGSTARPARSRPAWRERPQWGPAHRGWG